MLRKRQFVSRLQYACNNSVNCAELVILQEIKGSKRFSAVEQSLEVSPHFLFVVATSFHINVDFFTAFGLWVWDSGTFSGYTDYGTVPKRNKNWKLRAPNTEKRFEDYVAVSSTRQNIKTLTASTVG